jgi:imidazolonepropionase-like amidohydrolase
MKFLAMKTFLAATLLLITAPLYAQVVAIRAGTVIDPAHGTSVKDEVILVEGGKIKAMGAGLAIPAGAEVVDLSHEWLTPGLIDAHTHMTLTEIEGDAPFESFYLNQSSTLRGLRGLHNSMEVLHAGFTTLRDVGNSAEWAMSDVRRAIESGWFVGPTIIDSGKIIAPFGGQSRNIAEARTVLAVRVHRCGRPGGDTQSRAHQHLLRCGCDQTGGGQQPVSLFHRGISRRGG